MLDSFNSFCSAAVRASLSRPCNLSTVRPSWGRHPHCLELALRDVRVYRQPGSISRARSHCINCADAPTRVGFAGEQDQCPRLGSGVSSRVHPVAIGLAGAGRPPPCRPSWPLALVLVERFLRLSRTRPAPALALVVEVRWAFCASVWPLFVRL